MRMHSKFLKIGLLCSSVFFTSITTAQSTDSAKTKAKTAFQTSTGWMPQIDVRSDIAIVYGVNGNPSDHDSSSSFLNRVKSWREKGYTTHFMTGIAWGSYQDYFLGNWDGKSHLNEGQVEQSGDTIWHGENVPYIVPNKSFLNYMKTAIIEKVIDAGISSIYLEEPEFWTRAGYSSQFKKEWEDHYGFAWQPQHQSPESTWLSNKLKYQLYYNAIDEVSKYAKSYGKEKGLNVKVYIPTHSLINYSAWNIVSPEASLASLEGIDGYIAQVWTGTSRTPNYFNGNLKERTFENAFLEYGSMVSMTAPTNRKIFFLTDPIEDRNQSWEDYKKNYQATFVAKLLYPGNANYEVMPWPERIYTRPYSVAGTDKKILIPKPYSTQMQIMVNTLNDIQVSENKVSGDQGIAVAMSNSLMFQTFPNHDGYEDPNFSNFYGQTFPLLKRGIPVRTVHLENLGYKPSLQDKKVLILSYSNMKPNNPEEHQNLAKWVKNGGVLIYAAADNDPYQNVEEWWNTGDFNYKKPIEHLTDLLNIEYPEENQVYEAGKGKVYFIKQNPKDFVMKESGDEAFLNTINTAYAEVNNGQKLQYKNNFELVRGAYELIATLDESVSKEPVVTKGSYIDLFDPELPVLSEKITKPGEQSYLYNINSVEDKNKPQVLASASRIYDEAISAKSYSFVSKSPLDTNNSMRILLPQQPKSVLINNKPLDRSPNTNQEFDKDSKTLLLQFENDPRGVQVSIKW
ncbi:hypothetical protein SAMN04487907_101955 [Zunongwangia mangrovi]|uniref:Uncharacterized protein n=1 Tax=Zunongwangia mangrovi TaxID=1334022 RepID=A0A1I1EH78_9FLAO|nr:hypothetical protein SAMN04487907_101955 [Zunongwangia mangrovi]